MKYNSLNRDLGKDSNTVTDTLNQIKELLGKDFEVDITSEYELYRFLENPSEFLDDEKLVKEIAELKNLFSVMGGDFND